MPIKRRHGYAKAEFVTDVINTASPPIDVQNADAAIIYLRAVGGSIGFILDLEASPDEGASWYLFQAGVLSVPGAGDYSFTVPCCPSPGLLRLSGFQEAWSITLHCETIREIS